LEIPLPARTIWYRAIHNKIPTKSILHRLFPDKAASHNCLLCLSNAMSEETADHSLFICPPKKPIRFNIFTSYIFSTGTPSSISAFIPTILSLSLPTHFERDSTITPLPELNTYQIFACTLLHIWRAHWRFAFDSAPFISANIIIAITKTLNQLNSEMQLDKNSKNIQDVS
ncbi:hypothetical protein BDF21DRAFT_485491, partial [Thamnidium elegans]